MTEGDRDQTIEVALVTVQQSELPVSLTDGPSDPLHWRVSSDAASTQIHFPSSQAMYKLFIPFPHRFSSPFLWITEFIELIRRSAFL